MARKSKMVDLRATWENSDRVVSYSGFSNRLRRGWNIVDALTQPSKVDSDHLEKINKGRLKAKSKAAQIKKQSLSLTAETKQALQEHLHSNNINYEDFILEAITNPNSKETPKTKKKVKRRPIAYYINFDKARRVFRGVGIYTEQDLNKAKSQKKNIMTNKNKVYDQVREMNNMIKG